MHHAAAQVQRRSGHNEGNAERSASCLSMLPERTAPPSGQSKAIAEAARGTWVCRCSRMAQKSGGNRSWRVAAHWPHLMNAGPAASSTSLHATVSLLSASGLFGEPSSRGVRLHTHHQIRAGNALRQHGYGSLCPTLCYPVRGGDEKRDAHGKQASTSDTPTPPLS
jgi:hypothetical protein